MGISGHCPTCGQHHLAESDTEELHAMLAKCERLEREVLGENERLREQLRGAVEALEAIRKFGAVCDQYETCEHRACRDSHAAWAAADQYLRGQ